MKAHSITSVARKKFTILIWKRKNKRKTTAKLFFKKISNRNSIPKRTVKSDERIVRIPSHVSHDNQ